MKRLFILLVLATTVIAQNVMIFPDVSTGSNSQIQVSVEIENTDSFVGFQFDLPLGDELEYVNGTASLTTRANGHAISANIIGDNTLRVFAYSLSQVPFNGSEGAVCNFTIETGTLPGTYSLIPVDPIIGDANSVDILTSVTNGQVVLSAPDIDVNPQVLDYDRVPLTGYSDRSFTISNQGNATLEVSSITSSLTEFEVLGLSARSISGGSSESVTVRFHSNTKGIYTETVTILSDDPDEPSQTVQLDVVAYAVNELDINDMFGRSGHGSNMTIDIANMEPFVGFSFDLQLPEVMTYSPTSVQLTGRAVDHVVDATTLENGNVRIVAYSPSNTVFTGTEGDVVELAFDLDGQGGYYSIRFTNPVIGDANSDNILSDHYSGSLEIASPDLAVNQSSFNYGEVSIFDTSEVNLTISNYGSDTLHVSSLESDHASFWTETSTPLSINPTSNLSISIYYHNPSEGSYAGSLRVRSNDPDEDPHDIALSASSFIPNIMRVEDVALYSLSAGLVGISIENNEPFVGFQFDLSVPEGIEYTGTAQLSDRAQGHQASVTSLGNSLLRTIVYSLDQSEFTGSSGEVLSLEFSVSDTVVTLYPTLSDPVIGNAVSENVLSSHENGTVQVIYGGPALLPPDELILSEDSDSLVLRTSFHPLVLDPNTADTDLTYELLSSTHITVTADGENWIVAPDENWSGSENLQLIVSDENYADTTSWGLTVTPVNDAPVLVDISSQEIAEDSSLVIVLSAVDIDGDTLSYSAESEEVNLTILVSSDTLHVTPAADWTGTAIVAVTVDDGSGSDNATDTGTFMLAVTPVNDAPVLADIGPQNTPEETAVDVTLSANDIDEDALTFSALSDTSAVQVSVTGSTLSLTPQTDFIGDAGITVTVTDGTLEDSGSFTLTVSPVNDAPVLAEISAQEIAEDSSLVIVLSAVDIDGDTLSYSAESEELNLTILVSSDTLLVTPAANWTGTAIVAVTVDDGSGSDNATDTGTFMLAVTPVNDAPVLTVPLGGVSIYEDIPEAVAVDRLEDYFSDPDTGDTLSFTAILLDLGLDSLSILWNENDSTSLTIYPESDFSGIVRVQVTSVDVVGASVSDTLSVLILNVNDPPVIETVFSDTSIFEDDTLRVSFFIHDLDGDVLNVTVAGDTSSISGSYIDSVLSVWADPNWHGEVSITLSVSDADTTITSSFALEITSVNDPPTVFALISPVDSLVYSNPDSVFMVFDWEEALDVENEAVTYTLDLFSPSLDTSFTLTETNIRLDVESWPRSEWITWDIFATDGTDTTWCEHPFSIQIDHVVGVEDVVFPESFTVLPAYPNPFNPSTTIRYGLHFESDLTLMVYDLRGRVVHQHTQSNNPPGWYEFEWAGRDQTGNPVSSGVYFCTIRSAENYETIKMLLLK